jgi:hypothetical protein
MVAKTVRDPRWDHTSASNVLPDFSLPAYDLTAVTFVYRPLPL